MRYVLQLCLLCFILSGLGLSDCGMIQPVITKFSLELKNNDILSAYLDSDVIASISDHYISFTLPHIFSDRESIFLTPTLSLSPNTSIISPEETTIDFKKPIVFNIRRNNLNGVSAYYTVVALFEAAPLSPLSVTAARLEVVDNPEIAARHPDGVGATAITDKTIAFTLHPDVRAMKPLMLQPSFSVRGGKLIYPTDPQDFSAGNVEYVFQQSDGQEYSFFLFLHAETEFAITRFYISPVTNPDIAPFHSNGIDAIISDNEILIVVSGELAWKSLLLEPQVSVRDGELISPLGVQDFSSSAVDYVIQAPDGRKKTYSVRVAADINFMGVTDVEIESVQINNSFIFKSEGFWYSDADVTDPAGETIYLKVNPEMHELAKIYPVHLDVELTFYPSNIFPPLSEYMTLPRTHTFRAEQTTKTITFASKIFADARPESIYLRRTASTDSIEQSRDYYPAAYYFDAQKEVTRVAIDPFMFEQVRVRLFNGQTATYSITGIPEGYISATTSFPNMVIFNVSPIDRFLRAHISDADANQILFTLDISEEHVTRQYEFYWLAEPTVYPWGYMHDRSDNLAGTSYNTNADGSPYTTYTGRHLSTDVFPYMYANIILPDSFFSVQKDFKRTMLPELYRNNPYLNLFVGVADFPVSIWQRTFGPANNLKLIADQINRNLFSSEYIPNIATSCELELRPPNSNVARVTMQASVQDDRYIQAVPDAPITYPQDVLYYPADDSFPGYIPEVRIYPTEINSLPEKTVFSYNWIGQWNPAGNTVNSIQNRTRIYELIAEPNYNIHPYRVSPSMPCKYQSYGAEQRAHLNYYDFEGQTRSNDSQRRWQAYRIYLIRKYTDQKGIIEWKTNKEVHTAENISTVTATLNMYNAPYTQTAHYVPKKEMLFNIPGLKKSDQIIHLVVKKSGPLDTNS